MEIVLIRFQELSKINRFDITLETRDRTEINGSRWQVIPDAINTVTKKEDLTRTLVCFFN